MGCFVVAGFVLTSALRDPSAIAELLIPLVYNEPLWQIFYIINKAFLSLAPYL